MKRERVRRGSRAVPAESGRPGGRRNVVIESAITRALRRIDEFVTGAELTPPTAAHMQACDQLLGRARAGSAKAAALALFFYWLEDVSWNGRNVPVGLRGKYGDLLLSEGLAQRRVTMHDNVAGFGQNLGWKGNVRGARVDTTPSLNPFFTAIRDADRVERIRIADYLAYRFAESRRESALLPPVGADVLRFARAKVLFHQLIAVPAGGSIQQFLIAALLHEMRGRHGTEVRTHHPHAADAYDRTAGDIEEFHGGGLIRAYEVTMRADWKSRISGLKAKMDRHGLRKYVVIAWGINDDETFAEPAKAVLALEPFGRDIAVIDIRDAVNFFAAELATEELRRAVNKAFEYLSTLSGREEYMEAYRATVRDWLDTIHATPGAQTSPG